MTRPLLLAAFLLIGWLVLGRQVTLHLDRVIPGRIVSLPVSPLKYDGGGFVIGDIPLLFATLDNRRSALRLESDSANRVILSDGLASFTLGPRTNPVDPAGRPEIDFVADAGDIMTLTSRRSLLAWPTPFEIKIMGGPAPWWKRYVYHRLNWHKRSGANLAMLWRYEQRYFAATGWSRPDMMWNYQTALLSVRIQPPAEPESSVREYLARTRGWRSADYRVERRGSSADGRSEVFAILHPDDEHAVEPGAGKSIELYLDPGSREITKEIGGQ